MDPDLVALGELFLPNSPKENDHSCGHIIPTPDGELLMNGEKVDVDAVGLALTAKVSFEKEGRPRIQACAKCKTWTWRAKGGSLAEFGCPYSERRVIQRQRKLGVE